MNEQELDKLITEAIGRKELLDRIDNTVMAELRHSARRERIRLWLRLAAFAFGLPFVIWCFVAGAIMMKDIYMSAFTIIGLVLSAIVLIISTVKAINVFSIEEV